MTLLARAVTSGRPPRSSCGDEGVVDAAARVKEARLEIVSFEIGQFVENLGGIEARGEEIEHVADANPHPANARTASALLRIDGDAIEESVHDARRIVEKRGCINVDSNVRLNVAHASGLRGARRVLRPGNPEDCRTCRKPEACATFSR